MCASFRAQGDERKQDRAFLRRGTEASREQVGRTPVALPASDEAKGTLVHRMAFLGSLHFDFHPIVATGV